LEALYQFERDSREGREGVLWELRTYVRDVHRSEIDLFGHVSRTEQRWADQGRWYMRPVGQLMSWSPITSAADELYFLEE